MNIPYNKEMIPSKRLGKGLGHQDLPAISDQLQSLSQPSSSLFAALYSIFVFPTRFVLLGPFFFFWLHRMNHPPFF